MTPASWTDDDWQDAWDMLTGQWATLRRAGAEAGYRAVLTRFPVQAVAEENGAVLPALPPSSVVTVSPVGVAAAALAQQVLEESVVVEDQLDDVAGSGSGDLDVCH